MKALKSILIALCVYAGIVVAFESMIGVMQPATETTLVITTTGGDGVPNDRVLARLESGGNVYVAANHWPRAWYNQALENPNVEVEFGGKKVAYLAVPVEGEEGSRVHADNDAGFMFRVITGFPPREFLRLDPR
jgi:hypothetical protein